MNLRTCKRAAVAVSLSAVLAGVAVVPATAVFDHGTADRVSGRIDRRSGFRLLMIFSPETAGVAARVRDALGMRMFADLGGARTHAPVV